MVCPDATHALAIPFLVRRDQILDKCNDHIYTHAEKQLSALLRISLSALAVLEAT